MFGGVMRVLKVLTGLVAGIGATSAYAGGPVILEEDGAPDQVTAPARTGIKPIFIVLGVVAAALLLGNDDEEEQPPPCTSEC